jgi:hypothetical protein
MAMINMHCAVHRLFQTLLHINIHTLSSHTHTHTHILEQDTLNVVLKHVCICIYIYIYIYIYSHICIHRYTHTIFMMASIRCRMFSLRISQKPSPSSRAWAALLGQLLGTCLPIPLYACEYMHVSMYHMFLCMYMHVIYIHTPTHAHGQLPHLCNPNMRNQRTYTCACIHIYIIRTYTCACMHTYTKHTCTRALRTTPIRNPSTYTFAYMHAYIHTYIHTHAYSCNPFAPEGEKSERDRLSNEFRDLCMHGSIEAAKALAKQGKADLNQVILCIKSCICIYVYIFIRTYTYTYIHMQVHLPV